MKRLCIAVVMGVLAAILIVGSSSAGWELSVQVSPESICQGESVSIRLENTGNETAEAFVGGISVVNPSGWPFSWVGSPPGYLGAGDSVTWSFPDDFGSANTDGVGTYTVQVLIDGDLYTMGSFTVRDCSAPVFPNVYTGIGAAFGAAVIAYVIRRKLATRPI